MRNKPENIIAYIALAIIILAIAAGAFFYLNRINFHKEFEKINSEYVGIIDTTMVYQEGVINSWKEKAEKIRHYRGDKPYFDYLHKLETGPIMSPITESRL